MTVYVGSERANNPLACTVIKQSEEDYKYDPLRSQTNQLDSCETISCIVAQPTDR